MKGKSSSGINDIVNLKVKIPVAQRCDKCPLNHYCRRNGKKKHKPIPKFCREAIEKYNKNVIDAAGSVH